MAKLHGKFGQVQFGTDPTTPPAAPTAILGVTGWTLTTEGDAEEATDFNSGGVKEYLAGCVGHSATCEGWFNTTETKHKGAVTDITTLPQIIPAAEFATAVFWADVGPTGTGGQQTIKWAGHYVVTSAEYTCSVSGNVGFKLGLQGTGLLTAVPS